MAQGIEYKQVIQITCPNCKTKIEISDGKPASCLGLRPPRYETLTTREKQVLECVSKGMGNREIAETLVISKRTVEIHRANILRKLDFTSQHKQLINFLQQHPITQF